MRKLECRTIYWPAKGEFRISRSTLTEFPVVQVEISENGYVGRSECRPYSRYDETPESVTAQIISIQNAIETGLTLETLQALLPAGAARNAVDCALWDLKAKQTNTPVWQLANLAEPTPLKTAYTLSMSSPDEMAKAAVLAQQYSLLKIKIGSEEGLEACEAIISARPDAKLIVDANEALSADELIELSDLDHSNNIALIEQPFHASQDKSDIFRSDQHPIICADESLHTHEDLQNIWDAGYRAVNVKLDKTGGFTEALKTIRIAQDMGLKIMAGCMVGSSLAMAPMVILAILADFVDLDGPLILAKDTETAIKYEGSVLYPPSPQLWG